MSYRSRPGFKPFKMGNRMINALPYARAKPQRIGWDDRLRRRIGHRRWLWLRSWSGKGIPFGDRVHYFLKPFVAWSDRHFGTHWKTCFGCDKRRLALNEWETSVKGWIGRIWGQLNGH